MIRLNVPYTDHRELVEIKKVISTGYLTQGTKTTEFENLVAEYIGCKYAFAMSSCTTALHLSLVVASIKAGDEVLVADFTFPATANVVVQLGAIPVLVDINLDTYTINIEDLESKITPKSKAIIPVHTFGCSADMEPILNIAKKHGLIVIEDAACALGTTYYDRCCGTLADFGCFSFHPRKVITTGEGGMITTNNPEFAEKIKLLRNHGGIKNGYWYHYLAAGYNYRLSDINAAIGVAQMEKLSYLIERKRELAKLFKERLEDIPEIQTPIDPPWNGHIYQSFVIMVDDKINRDQLIIELRKRGVETTIGTYALHAQPFYQKSFGYCNGDLPNSYKAFCKTITLPHYPQLTLAELDYIVKSIKQSLIYCYNS